MLGKLVNVSLVLIVVVLLLSVGYYLGQRSNYNDGAIKAALADMTVHANGLEHKQLEVQEALANLAAELRALKSGHVNNILQKYGL